MPQQPKTPKIKHRAEVTLTNSKGQILSSAWGSSGTQEFDSGYRTVFLRIPVGTTIGQVDEFTVTVEFLGEKQYKQSYEKRVKALATSEKRREAWDKKQKQLELEKNEKELLQRRKRIVNQIELAFVKKDGAVDFITCDDCDAPATHLGLTHENPGSQVIDPDQITGAWCKDHNDSIANLWQHNSRPFKTTATIACSRLEFFYDGLRQIYVKEAA